MSVKKKTVPKVYVERGQQALEDVFTEYGWETTTSLHAADIVVLMGGADISSEWYGQKKHDLGHHPIESFDQCTAYLTKHAFTYQKPIIGICRGAQFINAVVGGSMYQHVDGHNRNHHIKDLETGEFHLVNSIHHQMMIPAKDIARVIAVGHETDLSVRHYMDGDTPATVYGKEEPEPEVIWYEHVKGLCFQAHPEYAHFGSSVRQYFYELLERLFPEYGREV